MPFQSYSCESLTPVQCYDLLTAVVTPRPIALVSTISPGGVHNLAPFSYFQLGGSNPPSLMISPTLSTGGTEKDTLVNIQNGREFVINIVTREMVEQMNITSIRAEPTESEWQFTCFTPLDSVTVQPPRVQESPVHLECKLFQILKHGDGPSAANYVIGEVVHFHVADRVLTDDKVDAEKLHTVGRLGADLYIDVAVPELFRLQRPTR